MIPELRCPNCNKLHGKNFGGKGEGVAQIEIVCKCHFYKKFVEPLDKVDEV